MSQHSLQCSRQQSGKTWFLAVMYMFASYLHSPVHIGLSFFLGPWLANCCCKDWNATLCCITLEGHMIDGECDLAQCLVVTVTSSIAFFTSREVAAMEELTWVSRLYIV